MHQLPLMSLLMQHVQVQVETAPWSLSKLLEHLKLNYGNPPVWIHENGKQVTQRADV